MYLPSEILTTRKQATETDLLLLLSVQNTKDYQSDSKLKLESATHGTGFFKKTSVTPSSMCLDYGNFEIMMALQS